MEQKYVKLQELLGNEEIAKRLIEMSPEDVSKVLAEEYDLEFTPEQLIDIANGIKDEIRGESDELSDSDLAQVSGGRKRNEDDYQFGRSVGKGTPVVVALVCVAVFFGW